MTNEDMLFRAIGEIDDELIEEASATYKKRINPAHGLTIAASIVIISSAILAASSHFMQKSFDKAAGGSDYAPPFNDSASDNNCAPPSNDSSNGSDVLFPGENGSSNSPNLPDGTLDSDSNAERPGIIRNEYGSIYNISMLNEYTICFEMQLLSDSPEDFDFVLVGKDPTTGAKAICSSGAIFDEYELCVSPTITVNGVKTSSLPTSSGTYTVKIVYSVIKDTGYIWDDHITITHFGNIE